MLRCVKIKYCNNEEIQNVQKPPGRMGATKKRMDEVKQMKRLKEFSWLIFPGSHFLVHIMPPQWIPLNFLFHECWRRGSSSWNNILHGTIPLDLFISLHKLSKYRHSRKKEQDAFYSHVSQTLSFWIMDISTRGSVLDADYFQVFFLNVCHSSTRGISSL